MGRRAGQFATTLTAHYVGVQLGPSVDMHRPGTVDAHGPAPVMVFLAALWVVWWSPTRHLCLWLLSSFVFSRTEKSTSQRPHPTI